MILPKAELHRHLEGSVRYSTWREIAASAGVQVVPKREYQVDGREPRTLAAFLSHFRHLFNLYPDRDSIERVAREAVEDAKRDGVRYLELRFSPVHFARRMKADPVKAARWVIDAATRAAGKSMRVAFIVTFGRDFDVETNEPSLKAALEHRGEVVGVDLAGDEAKPAAPFERLLRKAAAHKLKVTVHAGESSAASVREAVESLGAARIGHGVRAVGDPAVMSLAAERGIAFEMCPTSNHQTGACTLRSHPLKALLRAGVPVTINSDDPAISGTSLEREFALARRLWKLTDADQRLLIQNAIQAAFVEDPEELARFVWRAEKEAPTGRGPRGRSAG